MLAALSAVPAGAADSDKDAMNDLTILKQRIVEHLAASTPDAARVREWIKSLGDDGTWPDVDYRDRISAGWRTAHHIRRVQALAEAWAGKSHAPAGDKQLRSAIDRALNHWLAKDYRNSNWWWNEIGVPMAAGRTGMLLDATLTDQQRKGILAILSRSKIGMTGQNRVWLSGNRALAGCLSDDPKEVGRALGAIAGVIRVSSSEGLMSDWSFHQHGAQLYMGGYGRGFAVDCSFWARMAGGTPWAFNDKQISLLRGYLLEGQAWTIRSGELDASATGREITRPGGKARPIAQAARDLAEVDPGHAAELRRLADRIEGKGDDTGPVGCRVFWHSDFVIARRPAFQVSVKMHSQRVIGYEIVNDEGLRSYHLADGVTWILRHGNEYADLYPVMDWSRLPGVTCRQRGGRVPTGDRQGATDFVGGVTDGRYGAAAFDLNRDDVTARKSWFFFDEAVACLGAGITSKADEAIATTLNQCRLSGPVKVHEGDGWQEIAPDHQAGLAGAEWGSAVWHDGVGYVIARPADVKLTTVEQTGSWSLINKRSSREKLAEKVFTLWLDHGTKPSGASYACFLLPGADTKATEAFARKPVIRIVANTTGLQAAEHADAGVASAAFFAKGSAELLGRTVTVDKPCLLVLRRGEGGTTLTVADPTQRLRVLTVTIDGKPVRINLPTGQAAGSSVSKELK